MITTSGLTKVYESRGRQVTALDGVDLHVREGEVFGVIGQSGAGKSSLIRCVNLLERPTSGTVTVDGVDLTALAGKGRRAGKDLRRARSSIGMVFQHFNLLSSRTVKDNIELPLEILGTSGAERSRRALELLDLVGLADKAKAYPAQLSGGQKQRVGIARALAGKPKVLLSDEATSALDPETTRSILQLLRDLNQQLGLTVLLITHEMDVVKTICDSAALMQHGRVVESGTVGELLATPGSQLAAELFPVGGAPTGPDRTVVDVTFHGEAATQPVISQLSRTYNIDISILGAAMDTVGGRQIGRMRIELPGRYEENVVPVGFLREQGLQVEVVEEAETAEETGVREAASATAPALVKEGAK
ncbi:MULTISPECIES: methionine ABC transporter ATP-binding protein [Streptomyces]|uniref:ATP-binding cassette domain-containing protein n=1 Tax=Streptomyces cinereoruber TaxID=67260 RepID=A0AAV4KJK0_9ACTN|nr:MULTISPECIES: ATP-binding cassette domain-containing protein [Streptomyces]AVH98366.1 methionine ABC transporter ATP-binding protein [Streptomyces sp. WAC00288]KYG52719.1 methionine ABC transporter ATP-binding protein [Streptomyces sp. WAC04657]MBB4159394.1 D-methionine transport system ATP-binding protein [Streptomyces cinereoruber]MBY8817451.1 ATP-binding cassette domain-containing protein [Streptomyces cinereoruber]NIH64146.1 D-methionine transport system ATP-binding protein [Streptomyce